MTASPRVNAFLVALADAPDDLCATPPGFGVMQVKHFRFALEHNMITVHHSGEGFAFTPFPPSHGRCRECAEWKRDCEHCQCAHCALDRQMSSGRPITPAQMKILRQKIREFQIGSRAKPVVALDAD